MGQRGIIKIELCKIFTVRLTAAGSLQVLFGNTSDRYMDCPYM